LAQLVTVRHFKGLSTAALEAIADEMEEVWLPAGAELCRDSELPGLLVIQRGSARMSTEDFGEGRWVVGELGRGDDLGALSLVGLPATALVEALTPTRILKLNHSGFERAAQKFPEIRSKLEAIRDHLAATGGMP
jgi:CRP-like cAMP-binding protein